MLSFYEHQTKLFLPDGGEKFAKCLELSGEPYLPLISWTMRNAPGIEKLNLSEVWEWTAKREIFRYSYLQGLIHPMKTNSGFLNRLIEWNSLAPEMDVILCPAHHTPAPLHGTSKYWGYLSLWNLLDYPAVVFPVTRISQELDGKDRSYVPKNDIDRFCYEQYDVVRQKDAPVSLQLVAKRFEDEKLMQALKDIKESIGLPFIDCLA